MVFEDDYSYYNYFDLTKRIMDYEFEFVEV